MDLFKQAEKEYFGRREQQPDVEACSHQLINLSGVMTCNLCGLEAHPVFVFEGDVWNRAVSRYQNKGSISHKFESFCCRRNISDSVLSEKENDEIVRNIEIVCKKGTRTRVRTRRSD